MSTTASPARGARRRSRRRADFVTFDPHIRKAPPTMKIALTVQLRNQTPVIVEAGLPEIIAFERRFDVAASELGAVDRTQPTGEVDDDGNPLFKSLARFEWLAFIAHQAMVRQGATTVADFDAWLADVEDLGATEAGKGNKATASA